MAKLCEMKVSGKTNGTVVVANSILRGKVTRPVSFANIAQVKGALALERNQIIRIHGELPSEVSEKLGEEGRNRLVNQTFGKPTDAPFEGAINTVGFQTPSTKFDQEEPEGGKPKEADFHTPSTKNDQLEENPNANATTENVNPEGEFAVPSTENQESTPGLSREQIIEMTAAQLKSHIKVNELDVKGASKMNAKDLKNGVLAAYELDAMTEAEEAEQN